MMALFLFLSYKREEEAMFKILKVVVTGYKLIKDDFVIDFLSKARVYDEDKEKEVLKIDDGYIPSGVSRLSGGNSFGKSIILFLILL